MNRLPIFICCLLALAACRKPAVERTDTTILPVPWNDSSTQHPKHAALQQLLNKYRQQGLPGISLLVSDRQGTWVGATGFADIENKVPFQPAQVAKIASVTKLFIGALVFQLIEDSVNTNLGYGSLSQPLDTWLPERITDRLANSKKATLGDCLRHESGIRDIILEDNFYLAVLNQPIKSWKPEELLAFVYDKPAVFETNDTAIYSNTNTLLAAMVMEAATGKSHAQLLRQYILDPLLLNHTFYQPHDALPPYTAQGYFDLYNNGTIVNVSNIVTGSGNGFGGLFSNVFDMYAFIDALLLKQTLLSQKSLHLMQTYGKTDGNNRYGYGIMQKYIERGQDAGIGHSGRDLGYTANLFHFPRKGVTHSFIINYGTDTKSNLRAVFDAFQQELMDLTLQ